MNQRQISSTSFPILLYMVASTDHVTPQTGKTVTVNLSKNGGAFGAALGAVAEIGNGFYSLAGHATDRGTLGPLGIRATATGCDEYPAQYVIVPWDPFDAVRLGLAALPNAAAGANGGLPLGNASGQTTVGAMAANVMTAAAAAGDLTTELQTGLATAAGVTGVQTDVTTLLSRADVATSTRLATSGYSAPDNTSITAILGKLSGITSLGNWLRAVLRKSAPDATAASEIGGTYDATTDSQEAIRDRGDAAWLTGAGGGGGTAAEFWDYLTSAWTVAGSAGKFFLDRLDMAVSGLLGSGTATVGGPVTGALVLAPYTLPRMSSLSPTQADGCVVFGYAIAGDNKPAPNVVLRFSIAGKRGAEAAGNLVTVALDVTVTTNGAGYFAVELIQSEALDLYEVTDDKRWRVTCADCNLDRMFLVPSQPSVDIKELLP